MKAFDCGVPILAFDDNEVLVQALLMPDQNIYFTRSARPALQVSVVLDADFASFVQRRNQLFEASPIRDQFGNFHHIGRLSRIILQAWPGDVLTRHMVQKSKHLKQTCGLVF